MLIHKNINPINPKRVVILGAGGFVGSKLVEALQFEQIPLLALSSKDIDFSKEGADQNLLEQLQPNDAIVVLAVQKPNKTMDADAFLNNIKIAKNICSAIEKIGCAQVIYFSSDAVYSYETEVITEKTLAAPETLYGAMHLAREMLFKEAIKNSPLAIFRPTQIYGPTANHNAYGPCRMCRSAIQESEIELFGLGEERRDFIFIGDVVKLTLLALKHCSAGLLNLATGKSISYQDLTAIIKNSIGKPIEIVFAERKQRIKHRQFDIVNVKQTFPNFKALFLEAGVKLF